MWKNVTQSDLIQALVPLVVFLLAWAWWSTNAAPPAVEQIVVDMRNADRNEIDQQLLTQNYYEELNVVDRGRWAFNRNVRNSILKMLGKKVDETDPDKIRECGRITEIGVTRPGAEYVEYELIPNTDVSWRGHPLRFNRWGMRDMDYELAPPPNTFRIAIAGASNSMAHGVAVEEGYTERIEVMLNEWAKQQGSGVHYEVLNFSVGGYTLLDDLYLLERKAIEFQPDLMIIVGTQHDLRWRVFQDVAARLRKGLDLYFDFVIDAVNKAGVDGDDSDLKIKRELKPYSAALVSGVFNHLNQFGDDNQVPVMAIHLHLRTVPVDDMLRQQADLSEQAGLPTIRVFEALVGEDPHDVFVSMTDQHPTAYGHERIANELFGKLLGDPVIGPMIRGEQSGE